MSKFPDLQNFELKLQYRDESYKKYISSVRDQCLQIFKNHTFPSLASLIWEYLELKYKITSNRFDHMYVLGNSSFEYTLVNGYHRFYFNNTLSLTIFKKNLETLTFTTLPSDKICVRTNVGTFIVSHDRVARIS